MTKSKQASKAKPEARGVITASSGGQMDRDTMVAVAAYYLAERRAFEPGHEFEDWLEAERQIDASSPGH